MPFSETLSLTTCTLALFTSTAKGQLSLTYLGCFEDYEDRTLPELAGASGDNDHQWCAQRCCEGWSHPFSGTQYHEECWCGASAPDSSNLRGDGDCNTDCRGDSGQMCGGGWRNTVHQVVDAAACHPPSLPADAILDYVGCYHDHAERILPHFAGSFNAGNTPGSCAARCLSADQSFVYSGVQNSAECWCSSSAPGSDDEVDEGDCSYPCPGDGAVMCGGGWRNSVYHYQGVLAKCETPPQPSAASHDGVTGQNRTQGDQLG